MTDLSVKASVGTLGALEPREENDVFETPALYLSENLIDISRAPNIVSRLSAEEYLKVRERGREYPVARSETVFSQGDEHDGIFIIESGVIRTFYTGPSGREITLAYWTPGHFVGGPEIFGRGAHMWSGNAVEPSRILHLGGGALRGLIETTPALSLGVIEGLVFKGKCYSALVHMLGTRSVVERLAQLLITLCELEGEETQDGILIDRVFTHEELANMVGATRQWVTKTFEKFTRDEVIRISDRRIVVLRLADLQAMTV